MPQLAKPLTADQFNDDTIITADQRKGFKGVPRVVTLQGPFKLYKLTAGQADQHEKYGVTPWWSPVEPFLEDREGIRGRFRQAYMNGIDLSSMVRYMSAVKVEWNDLDNYVEISIKAPEKVDCFWGEYAPMPLIGDVTPEEADRMEQDKTFHASLKAVDLEKIATVSATRSGGDGYQPAHLPATLGRLRAWQFFIPKLSNHFIEGGTARKVIDAHDMGLLANYLGLKLYKPKELRDASELVLRFINDPQIKAASGGMPELQMMGACLRGLWELQTPPRQVMGIFVKLGSQAAARLGASPLRTRVTHFVDLAVVFVAGPHKL